MPKYNDFELDVQSINHIYNYDANSYPTHDWVVTNVCGGTTECGGGGSGSGSGGSNYEIPW